MDTKYQHITHTLPPIFNQNSKIIILGTMPSTASRKNNIYYGHPQNRFWKVLALIFDEPFPTTNVQKTEFALKHQIALWDVLASCDIINSNDQSIKNPQVNDLNLILKQANIQAIFTTGSKASQLYKKYLKPTINLPHYELPSTSPANCYHYNVEKLIESYQIILDYLK